jgi:hypothetical protein
MAKKNQITITRNGKVIVYETLPKIAIAQARQRIDESMKVVAYSYKTKSAATKNSVSKLVLNA